MNFINPAGYTPGRVVAWPLENHMTTQTIAAPAAGVHRSSDLFAHDAGEKSIAQQHTELEPHVRAMNSIERLLLAGHPILAAWSSGKDSSCAVNLALNAAINVIKAGFKCPLLVVSNADTGVESPVVRALADNELEKMRVFAEKHCIPLEIAVSRPSLSANFATRIIGGRALPPFPHSRTKDCTSDWKINPMVRTSKSIATRFPKGSPEMVTLIGTRAAESASRAINTLARKETAHEIWYSPTGEARLSPILDWSTNDVWQYIAECAHGFHTSYSDFQDTMNFYADAGASSCVIVADLKSAGQSKSCGARSGCWSCSSVSEDHSVENMLEQNPDKYPYLVPLLELRNFIVATMWDWQRRNFLGRTISAEGYIKVGADQYSPKMCEDLLYYMLAAQDRANELGSPSRIKAVGVREIIAIDFYWSLRGWAPPFHALSILADHNAGNRRYAPKIEAPVRPSPAPVIGEIYVGPEWDSNVSELTPSGLRHPVWESFSDSCGPMLRTNDAGKMFLSLEETPEFDVDVEGAYDFLEFIAEEKIATHHRYDAPDWTVGAATYLQMGTVTLAKGQSSGIDSMMRRTQWLQRNGLHGHQTIESLKSRCATLKETQSELFA